MDIWYKKWKNAKVVNGALAGQCGAADRLPGLKRGEVGFDRGELGDLM